MASMRLTLPSAFMHSDNTDALMDALRNHVDVDDPQFSLRKAVSVPAEFIELLGDLKLWGQCLVFRPGLSSRDSATGLQIAPMI